ncbi:dedicator of cytokinesis protein 3 isoform X1 [Stomoxys calcitrans]|uniref:dedicator of cytokinesis protein 3 isoform X1 n=1 Tax=Stomoxys calcitrans TaxID=35570 RepID=UPI0027E32F6F|nr:dedicator of cytokinesis protein 3 isoform X1 [Stomoxys calcitrans]XP_013109840.2 dedicator of cytokinesis protein 3 isoform X1 [Stomoxys calcitrans]
MWKSSNNKYGVAIHNWNGDVRCGLPLDVGDFVEIMEECPKWFRGTCPRKSRAVGIFPKTYIHIKDLSKIDPVVAECTQVLREWSEIWKRLYVKNETYKFTTIGKQMLSILDNRKELLGATLTQDQTLELQMTVVSKIDWGNRKLGLDLVPRIGPLAVDPHNIGIVGLHNVHVTSAENAKASSSRGTLRRKTHPNPKILTHHLYFCMREFGYRIGGGDDAEVYFYLYDAISMKAVSERFVVKMCKDGFANFYEKVNSNCTVFTDLGAADLNDALYLVAVVMRVGKILPSEKSSSNSCCTGVSAYRRPFGIGVLSLADIDRYDTTIESEEREYNIKLVYHNDEKDFHQLPELIIKKSSSKFQPISTINQSSQGIVVSLKLLHGGLGQARQEQPLLFQGSTITRKMGFPDVIMPGDVRNDMFITLEKGEFERGGKNTAKNILVTVVVLDVAGNVLTECLWGASGMDTQNCYKSMILYHQNAPCWNEMLRLSVPIDKFSTAHVRFEFRHCSTREKSEPKLFGFSFARLMDPSGATLADGHHELYVYKCEDAGKLMTANYLILPCKPKDPHAKVECSSIFHRSSKEVFVMRSLLCSTKLTQNADLLSLLQWRAHPEKIQDSLTGVLRLNDEELVKFLQDVLDALFAMFSNEEGNSTQHSGLVFHVLVSIFSLLQSNKFQHFRPVMNEYIENHFAAALVYKGLITSVEHMAVFLTKAEHPDPFQKCFGSLEYIFKLLIQSRKLFARATGGQYEDSFRRDLHSLFTALNGMLAVPSYDVIIPTQEALLSSTGVVLEQLKDTLPAPELGMLARNMLDAIPRDAPERLVQAKLKAVKDLVSGELFHEDDSRTVILSVACKHLRMHLSRRDELRLCAEILSEILTHLYDLQREQREKVTNTLQHDLDSLCKNILSILIKTIIIIIEGSNPVLPQLVACLLGLLQLLDETHYKRYWDELSPNKDPRDLKEFLAKSLLVFEELVSQDWLVFPPDWLIMKLACNDVLRCSLEEFAKPLVYRFLGSKSFDSQLWWSYFSLAVTFLTQPSLQLEKYREPKRRKILHSHKDMRVLMGFQILSMWSQLGEQKLHFIPSMVGPFLEVTLVPEPSLRKATLTVFYDMMQCEQAARGSFRLVESELIDKLDLLISENKGDDEYRELFSTMEHLSLVLLEKVHDENPSWKDAGTAFIASVTRLLERLLDYRSVMQGEENRDKRMSCTVNLLNFYKNEINRKEMYLRYIYKLHDLHLQAENYTEAGFTLKLYADMLSWDRESTSLSPNGNDGQPEWQRKERLYHEILKYFDKGKCWEKGIPLCKELALLYETKRFDYNKLSDILIQEAKFFQNILTQLRPEPEYFRVGFYGLGFPLFVRNKQFVYRGLEYERISAFTQRLQTEFPAAQTLNTNSPPDNSILGASEQYIQISNVRPVADAQALKTAMVTVPEKIARFYEVNDVSRFISDRPIHKGTVDKENEFKSLWIERTTLDIACPLPGILRWFEVKHKSVQELTPVEFACETMHNVGKDIWDLIQQYRQDPKRNINPFSMRLQGVIDANVMGGISKYQEAFFTEQFLKSPHGQGQQANVQRLKALILEKIQILDQALELHGQLAPPGVQPLHKRLLERFSQLKQSLSGLGRLKRQASESIVNTPLPPLPTEKRSISLGIHNSGANSLMTANANYYEHDEIYTRPGETLRPVEAANRFANNSYQTLSKENLSLSSVGGAGDADLCPPPIPNRPRSQNFGNSISLDGPEVPPKRNQTLPSSPGAPPLPPRGITPDKRASNPMIFNDFSNESSVSSMPRRPHSTSHQHNPKYVVDISFDDPEADQQQGPPSLTHSLNCHASVVDSHHLSLAYAPNDFRDSGISTASAHELNHLNNLSEESSTNSMSTVHHRDHCRLSSSGSMDNGQFMSASASNGMSASQRENSASSFDVEDLPMPAPPIPPKSLNILGSATMHESSSSTSVEGPSSQSLNNTLNHSSSLSHHHHYHTTTPHIQQQQHHHHHHSTQNGHNNDGYVSPKTSTTTNNTTTANTPPVTNKNAIDESHPEVGNTF